MSKKYRENIKSDEKREKELRDRYEANLELKTTGTRSLNASGSNIKGNRQFVSIQPSTSDF